MQYLVIFRTTLQIILHFVNSGQVFGRRVLPVKICSCPKRDMSKEEKDAKLEKNTVFRRTKKCISQEHRHHRNDSPCKIIKIESSASTESETENNNSNSYTLPVSSNF